MIEIENLFQLFLDNLFAVGDYKRIMAWMPRLDLYVTEQSGDRAALLGYCVGYILGSPTTADAIVRVQGIDKDKVLSEAEVRIVVKAIQDYIETYQSN